MKPEIKELLLQALETELGGIQIYTTALQCVVNADLAKEWEKYLAETREHAAELEKALRAMGLDPAEETPGRRVVRSIGEALMSAAREALAAGPPAMAEIVAAECVVLAETKDHQNWQLLGRLVDKLDVDALKPLRGLQRKIESQEDEHLYHTQGWARELWIDALGMPAVLPPPEEVAKVKSAAGAARARKTREHTA